MQLGLGRRRYESTCTKQLGRFGTANVSAVVALWIEHRDPALLYRSTLSTDLSVVTNRIQIGRPAHRDGLSNRLERLRTFHQV